jgi:glutathione synthase/RimK-type ligase-like ATP-grasp enzyme
MSDSLALILTNSTDATADYLCERLARAEVAYCRFDIDTALNTIRIALSSDGLRLSWSGHTVEATSIGSVVYRRPKPFTPPVAGDSSQQAHASDEWAEALEGFLAHVPPSKWINYPPRNFIASHKVEQLTRARACGLCVPEWVVTNDAEEAMRFLIAHGPELVAKPLASGYIERSDPVDDTLIYTQSINASHEHLFDRLAGCPVLFQARVNKATDVRVIVVDSHVTAVSLTATDPTGSQRLDIRRDNMRDVRYASVSVPSHVASGVRALMNGYGLRFAAIDFAIDSEGRWAFFEVNPNGQWAWLDLAGASDVGASFVEIVRSSLEVRDV